MSPSLFEPITLRGLTVRNRVWVPPMCQYSVPAHDGVATDWHLAHLGGLARGGAGAVIVEATAVLPQGRISPADLGLWNDAQRDALARVVAFMHTQGAAVGIQLAHAGRKASTWSGFVPGQRGSVPGDQGGWVTDAPSPIAYPGLEVPVGLTAAGIGEVVAAFAQAAVRARTAGVDLVELHAAHGYLLHQFLSPLSNHRTDGYGGSLAHRARLLLEVTDAVRVAIGAAVPLLVRLSATEWVDGGFDLEETIQVVRWLCERGVDLVDVSSGGNVPADIRVGPGYQVPLAAAVRAATGVPVAAVGLISEPAQAEQILLTGQADVVLLGRALLRDPHWPLQAARALRADLPYVPPQYRRGWL